MVFFTWCVEFKARGNGKIKKQDYVDRLYKMMKKVCEDQEEKAQDTNEELKEEGLEISFSTDYKAADFDFIIEVFRDLMLFSIVKHYKQRHKYNVKQLMSSRDRQEDDDQEGSAECLNAGSLQDQPEEQN